MQAEDTAPFAVNSPPMREPLLEAFLEPEVAAPPGLTGTAGFAFSAYNLMNAVLGAGTLGVAYAMRVSGIALFMILLVFAASLALFGIFLLVRCCKITNTTSYEDVGKAAFDRPGLWAASLSIMMQNLGAMTSYLVIVGEVLPHVLVKMGLSEHSVLGDRSTCLVLVVYVLIVPLCMFRGIGFLGYSSFVCIAMMIVFAAIVTVKYFTGFDAAKNVHVPPHFTPEAFAPSSNTVFAFPTMAFSFVCHTALLPIYAELKHRSERRMMKVANVSIVSCSVIYLFAALFGYLSFGPATPSDLLTGYTFDNGLINIVRIAFAIAMVMTVPVIQFPFRRAFQSLFFPGKPFSWFRHTVIMLGVTGATLMLAIFIPNIRDVFGVFGATSSVLLMAVLPGVFYRRVAQRYHVPRDWVYSWAGAQAVVGAVVGAVSVITILIGFFR